MNSMLGILATLSNSNKKWLADRLYEQIEKKPASKMLVFPKLPKDFTVSEEIKQNAIGPLPDGVDFERETEKMWEEMAR